MNRRLGWVAVLVVGAALGYAYSSCRNINVARAAAQNAEAPAAAQDAEAEAAAAEETDSQIAEQLKEIRTQVKEINALLKSGTLRVVVVINPGTK